MGDAVKEFINTAYHEAAHAVIGVHQGMRVLELSLVPDHRSVGHCLVQSIGKGRSGPHYLYAGHCAEVILTGCESLKIPAWIRRTPDFKMARKQYPRHNYRRAIKTTFRLLCRYQHAIAKVALAAMRRRSKKLKEKEILALIRVS